MPDDLSVDGLGAEPSVADEPAGGAMNAVARWREFERLLVGRGLGWGLCYTPAQLRYVRSVEHPQGADLEHLLPADYRAFVAEVGYPVLNYGGDIEGFAFLPPEAMAALSVSQCGPEQSVDQCDPDFAFPRPAKDQPTRCLHALFASWDLPDYAGYSFGPAGDEDKIAVWIGYDGAPQDVAGTFTEWLNAEMDLHEQHIAEFDDTKVAELRMAYDKAVDEPRMAGVGPDDSYHLLGYSLGGSYDQVAYTAEDLDLFWVGPGVCGGDHGVYGLIDGSGTWRIPYGTRFRAVRPFRDGVAEVIVASKGTSDTGPWTRIRPDGSIVRG
ncbi:SMI1/KNR4 family protein [Streptomyces sp. NBC_00846]|uniref:SMI1/KNR4 family protein n=1 Tax=Streptomyces sp. NBC_00846 TaxID=2975849 RepID=UPI00386A3AB0|nr:SMI1/KNR4 family protein [Streptomyces sp. NBC_00846]